MPSIGISLVTDRDRYAPGAPIAAELTVFNRSGRAAVLHFASAQRYEFVIENKDGAVLWRWSDGQAFAQLLGSEAIGPGREVIAYRETFPAPAATGRYRLSGRLVSTELRLSASVWLVVD